MTAVVSASTHADLEQVLIRTDPSLVIVPPRILRRVIKQDRSLGRLGLQVPHYKSYVIERDRLLQIANRDELRLPPERELPGTVILLPVPAAGWLRPRSDEHILL